MFVDFRISPARQGLLETSDARRSAPLEQSGFDGRSGMVSSRLEGSWDRLMAVIRDCHEAILNGYPRIVTTIVIVDDGHDDHENGWPRCLQEATSAVPVQIGDSGEQARRIHVDFRH